MDIEQFFEMFERFIKHARIKFCYECPQEIKHIVGINIDGYEDDSVIFFC